MPQSSSSHSFSTLEEWLCYIESIHFSEIDMGLTRIQKVADALSLSFSHAKVITVGGTNGKGTTCAFLENALLKKGYRVAVYSSPHIKLFNERLRIDKRDIDDNSLIHAFKVIEEKRGDVSLTYYEYTTLAALLILQQNQPDFIILEVGLGGRLDATNIIDADISVITTVDLDHQAFLGNDRESIGREKAGIMRANHPCVIGDEQPPASVIEYAQELGCELFLRNHFFQVQLNDDCWQWSSDKQTFSQLPTPSIPRDNIATALAVLQLADINFDVQDVRDLITTTKVPGRTELYHLHCDVMFDVGHNPLAARYLAQVVKSANYQKVYAVFGMMADKDIVQTVTPLMHVVDSWYIGSLSATPRGASANQIQQQLPQHAASQTFDNVSDAYKMAVANAKSGDLILVFGSFFTVAEVKALLN